MVGYFENPTSRKKSPIVVENSPVSFVITGPAGRHRQVLVRSSHDNLDLVALEGEFLNHPQETTPLALLVTSTASELRPYVLETGAMHRIPAEPSGTLSSYGDERSTYMNFVWKGLATKSDIEEISKLFTYLSADIHQAVNYNSKADAEWLVSKLVYSCDRNTNRILARRKSVRWYTFITVSTYLLIGVGAYIFRFTIER